jgi:hypothetical protein
MNKGFIGFLIAFTLPLCMLGQSATSNNCNKIKCGTFYFYPVNTQTGFVVIRKNSIQKEINLVSPLLVFPKAARHRCVLRKGILSASKNTNGSVCKRPLSQNTINQHNE